MSHLPAPSGSMKNSQRQQGGTSSATKIHGRATKVRVRVPQCQGDPSSQLGAGRLRRSRGSLQNLQEWHWMAVLASGDCQPQKVPNSLGSLQPRAHTSFSQFNQYQGEGTAPPATSSSTVDPPEQPHNYWDAGKVSSRVPEGLPAVTAWCHPEQGGDRDPAGATCVGRGEGTR